MNKWVHLFRIKTTDSILCAGVAAQWLIKFLRLQTDSFFCFLIPPQTFWRGEMKSWNQTITSAKAPPWSPWANPPWPSAAGCFPLPPAAWNPKANSGTSPVPWEKQGRPTALPCHQDKCFNPEDLASRADSAGWSLGITRLCQIQMWKFRL